MPISHGIHIQQNFFCSLQCSFFSAVHKIIFAFHHTAIIKISVFKCWHSFIFFFNPRLHFVIQIFLQGFCTAHHGIIVGILCFQVVNHLCTVRAFFKIIIHPVIIINTGIAMGN